MPQKPEPQNGNRAKAAETAFSAAGEDPGIGSPEAPKYDLIASKRAVLADLDRLEAISSVKIGNGLDGCILVRVAADPIDNVINLTHSTPAGEAGQFPNVGRQLPRLQIAKERSEFLGRPNVNRVQWPNQTR